MGVIEQVSRYDEDVNAARMATMKHFVERAERSIRRLQREGSVDPRLEPSMAADALGAMIARVAELWLVQGYREYDFDKAVEQLSILWANALGLTDERQAANRRDARPDGSAPSDRRLAGPVAQAVRDDEATATAGDPPALRRADEFVVVDGAAVLAGARSTKRRFRRDRARSGPCTSTTGGPPRARDLSRRESRSTPDAFGLRRLRRVGR